MSGELTPIPKRVKGIYRKPANVFSRIGYYGGILLNLISDTLFAGSAALFTAAQTQLGKLDAAQKKYKSGGKTFKGARDLEDVASEAIMDEVLGVVQKAADADIKNAVDIFTRNGIDYRTRKSSTNGEIEIEHGEISGSFNLYVRPLDGDFAAMWWYSTDQQNWEFADFSHNSQGFIGGLVKGKTYYFRAKTSSPSGKSDWTQIIEITCL